MTESSEPRAKNLVAIDKNLSDELVWSWARKASIDSRSASLVALGLGVLTVFLSLRAQLKVEAALSTSPQAELVVAGLVSLAIALAFAVLVAAPAPYPGTSAKVFREYLQKARGEGIYDHGRELIDDRVEILRRLDLVNTIRAWVLLAGFLAVGAAITVLAIAILRTTVW